MSAITVRKLCCGEPSLFAALMLTCLCTSSAYPSATQRVSPYASPSAEKTPADTTAHQPPRNTYHLSGCLSFSQSQSYDWMNGDKSILDVKSKLRHTSSHVLPPLVVSTESRLLLGISRLSSGSNLTTRTRATDNDLQAECKVVLPLGWSIDPYLAASLKSTITESFRESSLGDIRTATFWDPVTSEQACGMQFSRLNSRGIVTIRTGANLQQIRAVYHSMLSDDPKTLLIKERYKSTAGMECLVQTNMRIDSSITYTGTCQTRKNFVTNDAWQLKMENEFRIKIWKVFGLCIEANVLYDDTASKRVQFRQSTQIGILIDY